MESQVPQYLVLEEFLSKVTELLLYIQGRRRSTRHTPNNIMKEEEAEQKMRGKEVMGEKEEPRLGGFQLSVTAIECQDIPGFLLVKGNLTYK